MNQTTKIIFFILTLFIASSFFLFGKSDQELNPDYQKDWWVVSFIYAKNTDLAFTLENHSANDSFSWEIISGKDKLQAGSVSVARGEKKNINTDLSNLKNKIIVRIFDGKEYQEIYKNL